jgi:hypothetical protein
LPEKFFNCLILQNNSLVSIAEQGFGRMFRFLKANPILFGHGRLSQPEESKFQKEWKVTFAGLPL